MSGESILLVEDDVINMMLVQYVLEAEGYIVLKASTAHEALEQIEVGLPDLVLMDMLLPDMDGMTVVRRLRAQARTRGLVILALTACAMKGDREKMLQAGCDDYIAKPFDVKEFVRTVRRFLDAAAT